MVPTQRVLQVLASTDATDQNLAAVQLHASLVDGDLEVRTLALGPGRAGELASMVPVIAPSRRSIAAHTQLRAEQRWADVVILRGGDVAEVAAWSGGDVRQVLALWDEPQRWAGSDRPGRRVLRSARSCDRVIVTSASAQAVAVEQLQVDRSAVDTIHTAAGPSAALTTSPARAAAHAALGFDPTTVVVRLLGLDGVGHTQAAALHDAVGRGGGVLLATPESGTREPGTSALDAELDIELANAATDIVVMMDGAGGPSVELLQAMQAGAVGIVSDRPAMADLIRHLETGIALTGAPPAPDELSDIIARLVADASWRHQLASAGAACVASEFSAPVVTSRWFDTLRPALPSRP